MFFRIYMFFFFGYGFFFGEGGKGWVIGMFWNPMKSHYGSCDTSSTSKEK